MPTMIDLIATRVARADVDARLPESTRQMVKAFEGFFAQIGGILLRIAQSSPSPGYEPWFATRGTSHLCARGLAHLVVHAGRRRARDHQWRGKVVKALRELATPLQQKRAVMRRSKILLMAWEESAVLESIFEDAGQDVFAFIRLLEAARNGDTVVFDRLAEVAAALGSLASPRGRKMRAASEAHALFLEIIAEPPFNMGKAYTWNDLREDFTDQQTQATRLGFDDPTFNPTRAWQIMKRRRASRT